MHVYRLECGTDISRHYPTIGSAHLEAKKLVRPYNEIFIELLDVQIDKEGVVAMLNDEPIAKQLRLWTLTPRKGLKELEVDA